MKPIYIHNSACISPQETFGTEDLFLSHINITNDNIFYCIEPNYSNYINPVQIRRMSRALKMGLSTALQCLSSIDEATIDAIIIGTGKGCMTDTEQFLHAINDFQESSLNPTHFIHSTYNQLNGMVALNKKIKSYNNTYVHRGFSFEHAMLDAMMLINEENAQNVLVGSFDEITSEHFELKKHWNYWKNENINSINLLNTHSTGTIAGEGSAFFILSNKPAPNPTVKILNIQTLYKPSQEKIFKSIEQIIMQNALTTEDIDVLLLGDNGDTRQNTNYKPLTELFFNVPILGFKHICGEYDTASSFGLWLATQILNLQHIPTYLHHPLNTVIQETKPIRHILFYNNYFEKNQSVMLLSIAH